VPPPEVASGDAGPHRAKAATTQEPAATTPGSRATRTARNTTSCAAWARRCTPVHRSGLEGQVIDDARLFNDKLQESEDLYN
jgi:hypothetical protein